jgi:hypothetical protein
MDSLTTALNAIACLTLIALLVVKEFIRVLDRPNSKNHTRAMDVAIKPLLLVTGVILIIRFLALTY